MRPLIAIVDDDESVCRALKRLVRAAGMEANTFASGQEFIEALNGMPWLHVGCVVLDVKMSNMNGLEVQERLSRLGKTMPVVFITAHDEPVVREKALAAGALAFLHKPVDDAFLISTLREASELAECGS